MTDAATRPLSVITLAMIADSNLDDCVTGSCPIPDHHSQSQVNRLVDAGEV